MWDASYDPGTGSGCAPEDQFLAFESPSSSTTTLAQTGGRRKALLIGIRGSDTANNEFPQLKGSHQDVQDVQELLIDCYDYKRSDITILIDDDEQEHTQPTRDNILLAIAELVKDAAPGDQFCFHYCGHSTQIKNRTNSEEDGMDECIVPCDGVDNIIVDNELNATLVAPLPYGSRLVAVLDTCHAGSLLDLKHSRCNRVLLPWFSRTRRLSDALRHKVVRRNARMVSPSRAQTARKTNPPAPRSTTRMLARRSEINMNVVCCPPAARTSDGRAPQRSSTYRSRTVSLAESRNESNLPSAAPGRLLALAEECESPVAMFECTGWCREVHNDRCDAVPGKVKADVISLASCKDSQETYEDAQGKSMTASLVQILRRNPHQSLKDVLVHISHAMYTKALLRHELARTYKAQRVDIAAKAEREMTQIRRTMSLLGADVGTPRALAGAPTYPHPAQRRPSVLAQKLGYLKRLVIEMRRSAGLDMDTVEHPELASAEPLDMEREWRM
ncbi:caspase domain-containing protein [Mycena belliarum]|uniref:Caspase domain-containing protein n=1 Tax=Mycena belliarum TaxID=1033014 RepID=A0AAD6XNC2_9AGAR|nr:caspase domain-containing protein [Mycena belliae]